MVENSVGKLWLEQHPNAELEEKWTYYFFYLLPTAINSYNYITAQVSRPVSEALIPEPLLTQSVRIEIITDFSNRHKISQILLSEGGYDIKLDEYYSNKK